MLECRTTFHSLVEMGLLLFIAFSLLFATATPLRGISSNSCSSKIKDDQSHRNTSGLLHLTLHHPLSPCSPAPLPDLPISTVLSHDAARVRSIAARLSKTPSARPTSLDLQPESVSVPLTPGTSVGVGNYVTRISLGTPATSYVMVVDTGSSLSWLQCSPCAVSCHDQVGSIFDPSASNTYQSVSCSAPECDSLDSATLNPSACSNSGMCIYQASYGDSSFSVGYLSRDTLSLGGQTFPNFVYGCGQDNEGLFGESAGLIGLAKNKLSLLSQLAPKLGYSFSYCLPTTSSSGYLSIGSSSPAQFSYTPMVSNSLDSTLYFLTLTGISVAGVRSLSHRRHTQVPLRSSTPARASRLAVPEVDLVFQGGAAMKLPPGNVMFDVDSSTTCLAFAESSRVAIIGNKQQQTFSVAYDVATQKIGFAAGGCR
uniref:Peptidase A1 domain-containing protein n=1 Tax=Ananas comosus var. bracteatus TaxID=296719 RepID=A0A6V7QQY6_ANACO